MHYVNEDLRAVFDANHLFDQVALIEGEVYRELEARRTVRFQAGNRAYFAKVHFGVGWWEIFKNLFQLRLPIVGATNEWLALSRLAELDIATVKPVAFASEGWNPARRHSCIITEALENTSSLEDLVANTTIEPTLRRRLIRRLADVSRRMHDNGINHRDFYICHFLIDLDTLHEPEPTLYLIDLHRAQIRARTPERWLVKDLGGLFFSAFDAGIGRKDVFRFIKLYANKPLRQALHDDRAFWRKVLHRARSLYLQDQRSLPAWVEALDDHG
ncbi:MAG: lipopolysaccharide core heptose(I) kinase RfaP [Pseudomonadales bacterium]